MEPINRGFLVVKEGRFDKKTTYWTQSGLDITRRLVNKAIDDGKLIRKPKVEIKFKREKNDLSSIHTFRF